MNEFAIATENTVAAVKPVADYIPTTSSVPPIDVVKKDEGRKKIDSCARSPLPFSAVSEDVSHTIKIGTIHSSKAYQPDFVHCSSAKERVTRKKVAEASHPFSGTTGLTTDITTKAKSIVEIHALNTPSDSSSLPTESKKRKAGRPKIVTDVESFLPPLEVAKILTDMSMNRSFSNVSAPNLSPTSAPGGSFFSNNDTVSQKGNNIHINKLTWKFNCSSDRPNETGKKKSGTPSAHDLPVSTSAQSSTRSDDYVAPVSSTTQTIAKKSRGRPKKVIAAVGALIVANEDDQHVNALVLPSPVSSFASVDLEQHPISSTLYQKRGRPTKEIIEPSPASVALKLLELANIKDKQNSASDSTSNVTKMKEPESDLTSLHRHFKRLNKVVRRENAKGYLFEQGVPGSDDDDSKEDDDDETAGNKKKKRKIQHEKCTDADIARYMRHILITEGRDANLTKYQRIILGEEWGCSVVMFGSSFSDFIFSTVPPLIAELMKLEKNTSKFDHLLPLTKTLQKFDCWIYDYEDSEGLKKLVKALGRAWKQLLPLSDQELGIDAEFTRAGVICMLMNLKKSLEESYDKPSLNWI